MEHGPVANTEMCVYCFDVLVCHFRNDPKPSCPFDANAELPMFVTLNTVDKRNRTSLRGCIGSLSPRPLHDLSYFVMSSAFRDRRFSPLAHDELHNIELSVSLLVNYEDGAHYLDWEIDIHGIIVEFEDNGSRYSATYLPGVVPEQGWNREQAIESLVRKSGYSGKITKAILQAIKLTRYQSSKECLHFREYTSIRNGQHGHL